MAAMQLHWDIFCRVIDNYGDIGVCWRLARQLAAEHGKTVRLWVDELKALAPICPETDLLLERQTLHGVEVCRWGENFSTTESADVVIEAFACELPEIYLQVMAARGAKPVWVNLEYLTAESWTDDCHGMTSPHPRLPLVKYFVFPGFSPCTAGLLRERELFARRDDFQRQRSPRDAVQISLFCYDTAPVAEWLSALRQQDESVRCLVPPGKPMAAVQSAMGGNPPWALGSSRLEGIDFLPMDDYDHLLWSSDINFVRGEDSFIRAQWAGRPFVWQIYPQDDAAHHAKLEAFLERYCAEMPPSMATTVKNMFLAWNTGEGVGAAWRDFFAQRDAIAEYNRDWAMRLAAMPDLTTSLVNFCASKV